MQPRVEAAEPGCIASHGRQPPSPTIARFRASTGPRSESSLATAAASGATGLVELSPPSSSGRPVALTRSPAADHTVSSWPRYLGRDGFCSGEGQVQPGWRREGPARTACRGEAAAAEAAAQAAAAAASDNRALGPPSRARLAPACPPGGPQRLHHRDGLVAVGDVQGVGPIHGRRLRCSGGHQQRRRRARVKERVGVAADDEVHVAQPGGGSQGDVQRGAHVGQGDDDGGSRGLRGRHAAGEGGEGVGKRDVGAWRGRGG